MKAIHTKLLRDAWRVSGQLVTIALVVACGVASYVTLRSVFDSLQISRDSYYEQQRFAQVFAHLKRAPSTLRERIESIPGVAVVETREVEDVLLPVPDLPEPAIGRIVTLHHGEPSHLDALFVCTGRAIEPGRADEIVVLEAFAKEHALVPGTSLPAVINGVRRDLHVVGTAMSPEYVYATSGDLIPDPKRFGVLWMDDDVVAPAFQMDGSFNDVTIELQPHASQAAVTEALDRLLAPYGGASSIGRDRQMSSRIVQDKLTQISTYATVVPMLFLAVVAFLLNVVLARLVHLQRGQIATLKALGYSSFEVGVHYLEFVSLVVIVGAAAGVGLGIVMGRAVIQLYSSYFRFPHLDFLIDGAIIARAVLISFVAAFLGAITTVRRVASLPPAAAMQPEAPVDYRPTLLERAGLAKLFGPMGRMVLRELLRTPFRTALSVSGIALALGMMVASYFVGDAIEGLIADRFSTADRADVTVAFREPVGARAIREVGALPGVLAVEPLRAVPVRIRHGALFRDAPIIGHPSSPVLERVVEWPLHTLPVPDRGLMLTTKLAELLQIHVGDLVELDELEGDRRTLRVPVVSLVNESFGLQAHASSEWLSETLNEELAVSSVALFVDPKYVDDLDRRLQELPKVGSVVRHSAVIAQYDKEVSSMLVVVGIILSVFAATIAVGVIYNDARIALSLRARDLASLRVLGFTRAEISTVLLGEVAAYVLLAIPVGLWFGHMLAGALATGIDQELVRLPPHVSPRSYAFAVIVTIASALVSALLVRRKLDELDLVEVLKTRE